MGMTAVEKILARASGKDTVKPGDIIYPKPDFILVHDGLVSPSKEQLDNLGITRVHDPDKLIFVTDHEVIQLSERSIERIQKNREAAKAWGVKRFYDAGQGGHGHLFPMERGIVTPGTFYFDNDRHCTSVGGIGAIGFRVGAEIITVLATGTVWTKVPSTLRVSLKGTLPKGVYARDIGFYLASGLKDGGFLQAEMDYRVLEFAGDLEQFSLSERVALTNSPTEVRAYAVFVPPSEEIIAYAEERAEHPFEPVYSDKDAEFDGDIEINISGLEPQIAVTGSPANSVNLSEVAGTPIQHAFIGSCGSGMWDDLVTAAKLLEGKHLAPGVRMFVVPGTEDSLKRLTAEGLMGILLDAGVFVLPAGCGLCSSNPLGPLQDGEASISTASANERGRFRGSRDADMYLGSPATVAASAINGKITDPRDLL
ncbi:MAG: aconitase family protein [Rhodospirillaceae bacterium]|jgi:3-isopropylmalate/(R)-2-methylmalate dehydratase large subunit